MPTATSEVETTPKPLAPSGARQRLQEVAGAMDEFFQSDDWKTADSPTRQQHLDRITGVFDEEYSRAAPDLNPDEADQLFSSGVSFLKGRLAESGDAPPLDAFPSEGAMKAADALRQTRNDANAPEPNAEDYGRYGLEAIQLKRSSAQERYPKERLDFIKKTGLRPEHVDRLMDDREALERLKDNAVVMKTTGEVAVPPQKAMDEAEWNSAVDATDATPEKKAKAKAHRLKVRDQLAGKIEFSLAAVDPEWEKWSAGMAGEMKNASIGEKVERFIKWRKASGAKMSAIDRAVDQNAASFVKQFFGLIGGITNIGKMKEVAATAGEIEQANAQIRSVMGGAGATGFAVDLFGGLAPTIAFSPLARLATTNLGAMRLMGVTAAAQGYGGKYADASAAYSEQGLSDQDAHMKAQLPALVSAATTYILARMMPRGVESIAQIGRAKDALKTATRKWGGELFADIKDEAFEEIWQGISDEITAKFTYDPSKDMKTAVSNVVYGGLMGAVGGGVVGAVKRYADKVKPILETADQMRAAGYPMAAAETEKTAEIAATEQYWQDVAKAKALKKISREKLMESAKRRAQSLTEEIAVKKSSKYKFLDGNVRNPDYGIVDPYVIEGLETELRMLQESLKSDNADGIAEMYGFEIVPADSGAQEAHESGKVEEAKTARVSDDEMSRRRTPLSQKDRRSLQNRAEEVVARLTGPERAHAERRLEEISRNHRQIRREHADAKTVGEKLQLEMEMVETENDWRKITGEAEIDIYHAVTAEDIKKDAERLYRREQEIKAKLKNGEAITPQDRQDWKNAGMNPEELPKETKPGESPAKPALKSVEHTQANEGPLTERAAYGRTGDVYDAFGKVQRKAGEPKNEKAQSVPSVQKADESVRLPQKEVAPAAPSPEPVTPVAASHAQTAKEWESANKRKLPQNRAPIPESLSLPVGTVVRAKNYGENEGDIVITGPLQVTTNGIIEYPADFTGSGRMAAVEANEITEIKPAAAKPVELTYKQAGALVAKNERGEAFQKAEATVRSIVGGEAKTRGLPTVAVREHAAASGDMFHDHDGGFTFIDGEHILRFDKDGNLLRDQSEIPDRQAQAVKAKENEITRLRESIAELESRPEKTTRTGRNDFGETVEMPLSPRALQDARDKKSAFLQKQKARLTELTGEPSQPAAAPAAEQPTPAPKDTTERIQEAAYRDASGKIYKTGAFHDSSKLPKKFQADNENARGVEPGWLTSSGRFVGREEGFAIAAASKQVKDSYKAEWPNVLGHFNVKPETLGKQPTTAQIEQAIADANWLGTVREVPAPRSMGGEGVKLYIPVDASGKDVSVGGQTILGKTPAEAIELAQKNTKPAPAPPAAAPSPATPQSEGGIFGYSWADIRSKQQGGTLAALIRGAAVKPKATEADLKLLESKGADWLYDNEKFGVIDRLGLPVDKPSKKAVEAKATEGQFSIYQMERKDGMKWMVQSGEKRGFGDGIFDTKAEAEKYAATEKTRQQERAAAVEREAQKNRDEEAAKELRERDVNDFTAAIGATPLAAGKLKKTLMEQVAKRTAGKVYEGTRAQVAKQLLAAGFKPTSEQVDAVKDLTGAQMNRMDNKEQAAHEKRKREAGKKTEYRLENSEGNLFEVTKAEHDYAKWLEAAQVNAAPAPVTEAAALRAKIVKGATVEVSLVRGSKLTHRAKVQDVDTQNGVVTVTFKKGKKFNGGETQTVRLDQVAPLASVQTRMLNEVQFEGMTEDQKRQTKADAKEFDRLVRDHPEMGWYNWRVDDLAGTKSGDMDIAAERKRASMEAMEALGGDPTWIHKDNSVMKAELLPKLKAAIEEKAHELAREAPDSALSDDTDLLPQGEAPATPKLRPSDGKGTGELLQGEAAPFNLVAETAADIAKREEREAAEQVAKEAKDAADAKAKFDNEQGNLFDEDPFTIADSAPTTSLPVASVQRAVRVVAERLAGAMPHEVIADGNQYPDRVKESAKERGITDLNLIRGVVVNGKIWINAAAIENPRQAIETFMHEAAGHGGVDALLQAFGGKATTQLDAMLKRLFPDDYAAVQRRYEPHEQVSETLARIMQRVGPEMSAQTRTRWQRVVDWLRNALNKLGVKQWSTNDVMALLRRGVDAVRKQRAVTPDAGAVRMSYAGEKAQVPQFMRDSLDTAKAMAAAGKTSEEIRAVTGWFPGKYDGKMRWEVPDDGVRFTEEADKTTGRPMPLQNAIAAPDLFSAYPRLKSVGFQKLTLPPNAGGYFDPISNEIVINRARPQSEQISSLLHEVQHWIQKTENFAEGSDPSNHLYDTDFVLSEVASAKMAEVEREIQKLNAEDRQIGEFFRNIPDSEKGVGRHVDKSRRLDAISHERRALIERRSAITKPERDAFALSKYRRSAGELEARDVQARQNFTPEQRKAVEPYSSENIAKEDAIVMHGGGPQMSIGKPQYEIEQGLSIVSDEDTGNLRFRSGAESMGARQGNVPDRTGGGSESPEGEQAGSRRAKPDYRKDRQTWRARPIGVDSFATASDYIQWVQGGRLIDRAGNPIRPDTSDIRFSLKDENPEATSTKRAFTDAARASRGEEPTGVITKPAIDALKEGALAELARNPDAGRELVREIIGATGQPDITPEKEALLAMHRRTLQNEIEMQSDRAMDENLTPEQREIANERWDDLEQEITELEDATNRTGSAWSNWGRIRMQETLRDFSFAMLTKRARKAKGGEQLTRDERAELKAQADAIIALHEKELARRTELANIERDEAAAAAFQQGKAEAEREAEENQPDPLIMEHSRQFVAKLRAKYSPAVRSVMGLFDKGIGSKAAGEPDVKMSLAPDPEKPEWFTKVVQAGVIQMADKKLSKEKWLASLKVLTRDTDGNLDPYADELWAASRAIIEADIAADTEESKRVKATKMKRNASKEQLIEGMKEQFTEDSNTSNLGRYLKKLAVRLIESGVDTREALVDAMHDSVKDIDPSLNRETVMDLWSDYGKFDPASTEEVKVKAAQLRGEVQQSRKLLDMMAGELHGLKLGMLTGKGRVEPSAEYRRITKLIEDAKRRGFKIEGAPTQIKTALGAIQTRLRNEIADMNYAIAKRKPLAEHKNAVIYDTQTKALKAQRDAKKAEYEKLFPKDTAAADIAAISRALDRSIAELSEQIKSGDLYPGKQGRRLTSLEIEAKRARIEALRDERTVLRGLDTARVEAAKMAATQARVDELNRQRAAGWPDSPTGTPTVDTPLLAALKAKRDELLKERQASQRPPTDPEMREIEALDKLIAEKQAKIAAGDTSSKPKSQNVKTAQVTAREAELRRLTVELAKLRNSDIARQLEQLKSRKSRQLADLLEKIAKKDFEPKAKPPEKPTDPELQSIEFQVSQAKGELMEGMADLARSRRTRFQKAKDTVADVFHTLRALMTGGEFSGVFRQGKLAALSHPVITFGQSVPAMFRAFGLGSGALTATAKAAGELVQGNVSGALKTLKEHGESKEHAEMNKIWARPNAAAYKRSGLALHNPWDFTAAQLEGNYRSRWANKIPFIAGSGRAYTLFLNNLRAGLYDTLSASLSSTEGVLTAGQEKEIANLINKMTGSGNLGARGQKASEYLNVFFFAPKFVASRFQMITGAVKVAGDVATGFQISKENNAVRKLVAKEYGRMLTGIAVMYALYAAFRGDDEPIETDPRSTKFGKIPMGNGSYIDPMAGLLQVTVFLNTLWTGEVKNKKGEIKSVWMADDGTSAFGQGDGAFFTRFLRSKMSPAAGTLYDRFVTHKMVDGKPFTYTDAVLNFVTPMTYKDIYEAMRAQGVPKGTILSTLTMFGEGLSTYENDSKPTHARSHRR